VFLLSIHQTQLYLESIIAEMHNVLTTTNIATHLTRSCLVLLPVLLLVADVKSQPLEQESGILGHLEYPEYDSRELIDDSYEEVYPESAAKRAWASNFSGGMGKRAWNSQFSGGIGKRAWNSNFSGGMGKRAWNSGFAGGVGKRAWNSNFSGGMGKRAWNSNFSGGMGKRAWNSGFAGGVGK